MNTKGIAWASALAVAAGSSLVTVAIAAPSQASISGSIVAVSGSTFTVSTSLSPTGRSKVTVGSKTTLDEQKAGSLSALKKGVCVSASGTKSGSKVNATRISVLSACTAGSAPGGPGGGGFQPPAGVVFATGTISSKSGSTIVVKSTSGSATVVVNNKTQITRTVKVTKSALKVKLCAFVRGTSSDGEKSVQAQLVRLNAAVNGVCSGPRGRP